MRTFVSHGSNTASLHGFGVPNHATLKALSELRPRGLEVVDRPRHKRERPQRERCDQIPHFKSSLALRPEIGVYELGPKPHQTSEDHGCGDAQTRGDGVIAQKRREQPRDSKREQGGHRETPERRQQGCGG